MSTTEDEQNKKPQPHPTARKVLCYIVFVLSVTLGLTIGYFERTPEFNTISSDSTITSNRTITLETDLVSIDATAGTIVIDWSVVNDSACNPAWSPPCPGISSNTTVNFFFDANVLIQTAGLNAAIQSDNVPSNPIFIHNGTAVASVSERNSLAAFRTNLELFSTIRGRSSLSTLQKYLFDVYTAQIFIYAKDSLTGELVGLKIAQAYGVAVGFRTRAAPTPLRQYPNAIAELITVSRSVL